MTEGLPDVSGMQRQPGHRHHSVLQNLLCMPAEAVKSTTLETAQAQRQKVERTIDEAAQRGEEVTHAVQGGGWQEVRFALRASLCHWLLLQLHMVGHL